MATGVLGTFVGVAGVLGSEGSTGGLVQGPR